MGLCSAIFFTVWSDGGCGGASGLLLSFVEVGVAKHCKNKHKDCRLVVAPVGAISLFSRFYFTGPMTLEVSYHMYIMASTQS